MPFNLIDNFNVALALDGNERKKNEVDVINFNPSVAVEQAHIFSEISKVDINAKFNFAETLMANQIKDFVPEKFGVLEHIDLNRGFLKDAIDGILDLRGQLFAESTNGVKSLRNRMDDLLRYAKALNIDVSQYNFNFIDELDKDDRVVAKVDDIVITKGIAIDKIDAKTNAAELYPTALFSAGNALRSDVRLIDQIHVLLMRLVKDINSTLTKKRNELSKLDEEIPIEQRNLANLNQERIKAYAEYQMVLSLVAEDWNRVEQEYRKRERILTNNSGLYFVRAQETPFTKPSPVDKSLRYGRIEDLVPATAISQDELPEEIEDYIETIVDIPIANWKPFNESWNYLPSRNTIIKLMEQRKLRLTYLSQKMRKASSSKFVPMLQIHQSILQDYARFEFLQEASLQAFYRRAVEVISLEDLLTGTPHQLRGKAQAFRNQLDQATHALLAKLQNIKPGIRLEWATQAELDQLDLRNPYSWPGLKDEQQEDIGNVRSMIELVNWWWRQLNDNASSSSVTAVRNLLRAALMVSVGDDPKEMIHGYLQVIPSIFKAGDVLRARLNRHAPIGTLLQLVNENNQLVGKLRIEDADENGSLVSITQILGNTSTTGMSQFSVIGIKTTGRSFV